MTLNDVIVDIHSLGEDLAAYERKYGILSETFFDAYQSGEEPSDDAWVLDWSDWAGAYKIWLRRQEQYQKIIQKLKSESDNFVDLIKKANQYESISINT